MIEELRGEFKILRDDVSYLRQCMRDNCLEYIKLQEEMKAELQYIRLHVQSYPQTQTSQSRTHVDNKECQFEVVDTKDTTFYIENHLNNNDFSLPLFNENTVNPVFNLKQLDNYINLKKILNDRKLILAYKSMNSEMSKQWIETVINNIRDYKTFKKEFFNTWWSTSEHSLVKCSLYQGKYDKQSNMSLTAHFLKYATVATYLQPKLSEVEIIYAIHLHYPLHIQRVLLTVQSKNISETLNLLKRIEVMENHKSYLRTANMKDSNIRKFKTKSKESTEATKSQK
jgi:hypothetical protein